MAKQQAKAPVMRPDICRGKVIHPLIIYPLMHCYAPSYTVSYHTLSYLISSHDITSTQKHTIIHQLNIPPDESVHTSTLIPPSSFLHPHSSRTERHVNRHRCQRPRGGIFDWTHQHNQRHAEQPPEPPQSHLATPQQPLPPSHDS